MQLPLALAFNFTHAFCTDPTLPLTWALDWLSVMHAWFAVPCRASHKDQGVIAGLQARAQSWARVQIQEADWWTQM